MTTTLAPRLIRIPRGVGINYWISAVAKRAPAASGENFRPQASSNFTLNYRVHHNLQPIFENVHLDMKTIKLPNCHNCNAELARLLSYASSLSPQQYRLVPESNKSKTRLQFGKL